jgi:hypothetical protein
MNYCKYHPLAGATYHCHNCTTFLCDRCVDDSQRDRRCFCCATPLESLGSGNTVPPFWRRLPEAFRYPLNSSSLSLIIGMAVLTLVVSLMPFLAYVTVLLYLFAAGSVMKYSFSCLERTALGNMKAPDVMEAYEGGIRLLRQLIFMTFILGGIVVAGGYYLGMAAGGVLLGVVICIYPAMLIRFAITQSLLSALNPMGALSMITAIGLPYGLLMAFLLIMVSSVAVLQGIIGSAVPALSYLLQGVISNYYTVVMFHLMGYMLFQYQSQLGYSARMDDEDESRPDIQLVNAKLDVLLKEGQYEQLVAGFYQAFKQFPQEASFYDRYYEFLCACKKPVLLKDFAGVYLQFWSTKKRFDKLTLIYKQILLIAPDFMPQDPALRMQIAQQLQYQGDNKQTIKLLSGMHKLYPDFSGLGEAYGVLAKALEQTPGMQSQAEKCLLWVEQFKRKQASQALERQVKQQQAEQVAQQPSAPVVKSAVVTKSGLVLELVPIDKEA